MTAATLVFDLDDTLYLERDFAMSGFDAVGAVVGEATGVDGFAAHCRALFCAGERTRIFDRALELARLESAGLTVAQLIATYRDHRPTIALAPDVAAYFAGSADGATFGLITDGHSTTQHNKIEALGLAPIVRHVRVTGDWGRDYFKPHPRAFEDIAAALDHGLPLVYVADNPKKDFVTPNRLGWRTIQIERPDRVHRTVAVDHEHAAQAVIATFAELEATVASLV